MDDQIWQAWNDSDNEKPFVGATSAAGYALAVYIAASPDGEPVLTLTPSIATVTITPLMTRAQTNTLTGGKYKGGSWFFAIRRTDSGSFKPLAAGKLNVGIKPTSAP